MTRELGRLNECVADELEKYAVAHPDLDPGCMTGAWRIWGKQCGDAVNASAAKYFTLQQIEASSHIRDLERAPQSLRELEQERARLWQQAAHDLRGNLGVVATATAGLASPVVSEPMRTSFLRLLDRNVSSLSELLNDVTSLARLQGGLERSTLQALDAAALLATLCDDLQPHARERGLYLRYTGPASLHVGADSVKVRRIAQDLVINAIKYTRSGGVTVSCGGGESSDVERWFFEVRDTEPGFHAGPGSQLAGALEDATDQARQVASDHSTGEITHFQTDLAGTLRRPTIRGPCSNRSWKASGCPSSSACVTCSTRPPSSSPGWAKALPFASSCRAATFSRPKAEFPQSWRER
ncbi:HAMP domain-containing histidine kinase [Pelomonas sp. P8]|uniref:histidine kinase n=1 Tax=Pelomonas cellulosilytica TaxID=2906762 RepID=A0ABS8Y3E0_9BURK|nr:HAMP domain-containing sensor histidine kinase [Pelomonas sp. P8]MCE4558250.1 HAMP domain-containing histidine kinase [Pelomonas sp. P8]